MIVLDASLMVAWLLGEQRDVIARDLYESLSDETVLVPSLWAVEMSNALRSHLRSGKFPAAKIHAIMDQLDTLDIQIEAPVELDEIGPLAHFAMVHELTAYDAAYVQLALGRGAVLATLDHAMRSAARRLNIALLPA